MSNKLKTRIPILASAFIGGVLCILADLIQKSEASAVLLIGEMLDRVIGIPFPTLFAIGIILIIAVSLPFIFETTSKKGAFYAGASVLAIMMTATPYNAPPGLKTNPNSVEVNLSISTQDGGSVEGAIVTVSPLDVSGNSVKARSKMQGAQIKFYLDGGAYRIVVELPGYWTETRTFSLREGSSPQPLSIILRPSSTPLFIQRILR